MIEPTEDQVLAAVIAAVEDEIAPAVENHGDEYVVSLCRTVAQMLRHVSARIQYEPEALRQDIAELRALIRRAARENAVIADRIADEPAMDPSGDVGTLHELRDAARTLRAILVSVIEQTGPDGELRSAVRAYIAHQLRRELPWQQHAYTGPRR